MKFAADKYAAEFGGVKIFTEEYSFERAAETGETVLTDGRTFIRFGGGGTVKIKLFGTADRPCADRLDSLLKSGVKITLKYAGMVFKDVMPVKYSCTGKSGSSEKVAVEFIGAGSAEGGE